MKDTYIFPSVFSKDECGFSIIFPDLPGCFSCADTMEKAFKSAKEAMQLHLYFMEKDGDEIPVPTPPELLQPELEGTVVMIEAWMPAFREQMTHQTIKRKISLPKWLDEMARHEKVNLSAFVEESLKKHLGVIERS